MTKLAAALAVLSLLCWPGWAQEPGGRGRGPMMMRSPAFTALDTDGDGVVSAAEIANAAAALKVLDKNGDGKLTEDEVRPSFPGRGGRGEGRGGRGETGDTAAPTADDLVKTWMAFDKNGDGKLSKDEVPERMQGVFDRADSNKDGVLTVDEIRQSAQAQAAPGAGRGGRDGGRGEGMSFMRIDPILAALDTDGDGVISAAELSNAPASLKKLDKNGDGQLTQDEVRMNMPGREGRRPERN